MDLIRTLRRLFAPYHDVAKSGPVVDENRRSTERLVEKVDELRRKYEAGAVYHDISAMIEAIDRRRPPPSHPGASRR